MYQAIPVIVLTMEIDIETEIKCLGMGAWDFIRKPYDVDVVRFRLKNVIGSSSQNISKALKYRAEYDILTGIYNKTHMFQATSSMLERYPDRHFAFVRMDIEKFQLINSFFGMSAGDMLLKYIADLLICAVRTAVTLPLAGWMRIYSASAYPMKIQKNWSKVLTKCVIS